ncbi:hypothetical protein ACV4VT_31605, partial [Pseudomonas aeruginosa]
MQIEMNALTNPLEMTLAYDSGGEGRNSRNAPKFIVHFPLNLYEALIRLSVLEERSLNGEVVAGLISGLRIPRHSDTQPTLIRTPVPRSFGQAV